MRKLLIICRYLVLTGFVLILFLEIYFRIVRKEQWVKHEYPKIYVSDTICGYKGIPNIQGSIRRPSINKNFKLNKQGFYGPDFDSNKPDSIYRIIVTGASGVEGIWANHKESFPLKMHNIFQENGFNVEVVNCAVSGNDRDFQNIKLIENYLVSYKPDIILHEGRTKLISGNYHRDTYRKYSILFTGNTTNEREHSRYLVKEKVNRLHDLKLFTHLWNISYCVRFIVRQSNTKIIPSFVNCMQKYVDNKAENWNYSKFKTYDFYETIEIFNRLNKILEYHSCKLVLFDYSSSHKKEIFANKDKIEFSYVFLNISGENLTHRYDEHFNETAHTEIAKQLYRKISRFFIPERFLPTRKLKKSERNS